MPYLFSLQLIKKTLWNNGIGDNRYCIWWMDSQCPLWETKCNNECIILINGSLTGNSKRVTYHVKSRSLTMLSPWSNLKAELPGRLLILCPWWYSFRVLKPHVKLQLNGNEYIQQLQPVLKRLVETRLLLVNRINMFSFRITDKPWIAQKKWNLLGLPYTTHHINLTFSQKFIIVAHDYETVLLETFDSSVIG